MKMLKIMVVSSVLAAAIGSASASYRVDSNGKVHPITAPGKFQPRSIIVGKHGNHPITAPGKFQPR
jgi:hypothetical protein